MKKWYLALMALVLAIIACDSAIPIGSGITPVVITPTTTQVMGTSTGDWYEVYFTSPVIPFDNVFTGGIEDHLIQKINAAQNTIDLAVYDFNLDDVTQALIQAKQRGVIVRVVYDNGQTDAFPQMTELIDAGIPAVPDNRSVFMHDKFFVFDDQCIWTGSFNISVNAAYRNNENALSFCSPEAAANYTAEFTEMFAGQFGPSSPANTPYPIFTIDGATIENYFAPEDSVMAKIIATVEKAQTHIHFMAYSFTYDDLAAAMLQEMSHGVEIGGVFETFGANTPASECSTLLTAGADISLDGNPKTFHHKVIIIDGTTVILGSFNFSANANEKNDENLLIIHDTSLASAYEQEYQRMKLQSIFPTGSECSK
ncbi:phospholipase [bacterium]|nr:MAG: phospholipase [bacterium]